jgi:hypothetical protein
MRFAIDIKKAIVNGICEHDQKEEEKILFDQGMLRVGSVCNLISNLTKIRAYAIRQLLSQGCDEGKNNVSSN